MYMYNYVYAQHVALSCTCTCEKQPQGIIVTLALHHTSVTMGDMVGIDARGGLGRSRGVKGVESVAIAAAWCWRGVSAAWRNTT